MVIGPPTAAPVTRPVAETVAIVGSLEAQATGRSVRGFPAASRVIAESCTVVPRTTAAVAGVTLTDATGGGVVTAPCSILNLIGMVRPACVVYTSLSAGTVPDRSIRSTSAQPSV